MVALGVRLAQEPGLAESGSGIAPRACIPIAIASYSSWSVVAQSRYSVASSSRNMIPNIDGCPVKWYGIPTGLRISLSPSWRRRPVAWIVSSASVSLMMLSVLTAAEAAIRLPAYVPPWLTLSGRTLMTSRRPPKAAAGYPLPIAFA